MGRRELVLLVPVDLVDEAEPAVQRGGTAAVGGASDLPGHRVVLRVSRRPLGRLAGMHSIAHGHMMTEYRRGSHFLPALPARIDLTRALEEPWAS
jgi:hypothetical protein